MSKPKKIVMSLISIFIVSLVGCSPKTGTSVNSGIANNNEVENEDVVRKASSNGTYVHCGVERWSVKTGTDSDSKKVNLKNIINTTIDELIHIAAPDPNTVKGLPRLSPTETTVFSIDAILTQFRGEGDSDYHLVLQDSKGNTMIAEIPSPDCVGSDSPFALSIVNSRKTFDSKFTVIPPADPTDPFQDGQNTPVRITGLGFFDFPHGQNGLAKNAIELHPVLSIEFNPAQKKKL